MDGVVQWLRTVGSVVAEPAHVEGDVLLDELGILLLRRELAIASHGSLHPVVVFHGGIGQRAGPPYVGEFGALGI